MAGRDSRRELLSFFKAGRKYLALTAVTGIIYNVGMTAGPWFEGQLAQYLFDILKGLRQPREIVWLSLAYVVVIALVQGARALKRLFVRKFANDVSRSMKERIYHHLLHEPLADAREEGAGAVMTRAISDADACAEGMRKFVTEIFDTGVVMIAYLVMLLALDWRLTLLVIIFPPIAYVASAALKKKVTSSVDASRQAMARLNGAAVDGVSNALTYRIYGEDGARAEAYEDVLDDYERRNVAAGIWQNSPQPVYLAISMIGVIPILYFGGANVLGTGWSVWTIATFSSFLSCFSKLATKSSHAAKLFNAVQKAEVSWQRIEGYLVGGQDEAEELSAAEPETLEVREAGFTYPDASADGAPGARPFGLHGVSLTVHPGEIVGITGRVASGKSSFGRLLMGEIPYEGSITYGGRNLPAIKEQVFGYSGHDHELFTGTVRENVAFAQKGGADEARLARVLHEVRMDAEVAPDDPVGREGAGLSGGQQARLALARALYSDAPVLVLDDPFASVDKTTEQEIFQELRAQEGWRSILIISHRIALFPEMDQVVFLEDGAARTESHEALMRDDASYRSLFELQQGGEEDADER